MKIYFFVLTMALSLACTVSTIAESPSTARRERVNTAERVKSELETHTETTETAAMAKGRVNVRACAGVACGVVGFFEPRAVIVLTGAVIRVNSGGRGDCAEWYPVEWRGGTGYVCAKWVTQ